MVDETSHGSRILRTNVTVSSHETHKELVSRAHRRIIEIGKRAVQTMSENERSASIAEEAVPSLRGQITGTRDVEAVRPPADLPERYPVREASLEVDQEGSSSYNGHRSEPEPSVTAEDQNRRWDKIVELLARWRDVRRD